MSIDYTTPVGQVRLLIADVNEGAFLLSNEMLTGYLALNSVPADETEPASWSVKRAAADALAAIATSEALVSKVIRTGDGVTTDGAKLAAELRAQAAGLRKTADQEEAADESGYFGVVEFTPYPSRGHELTERSWF